MVSFYRRFSVVSGFIILLVLLAANGFVTRRQVRRQVESQDWVVRTQHYLLQISESESLLKDAETGQRGYLYTGNEKYLAPYDLAAGQIDRYLQTMMEYAAGDPHQQAQVAALGRLAHQKLDELAKTIALARSGHADDARVLVLSNVGLSVMDDIRVQVREMEAEAIAALHAHRDEYRKSVRRTVWSIYITTILAGLGLMLLAYYILREMEIRERYSREMREREEWYRVTLTSVGDGVIATDGDGYVSFINPVAEDLTGRSLAEARGLLVQEIFPIYNEYTGQMVDNPVAKVMQTGTIVGLANHTVLRRLDGTVIPIEDSAAPIRDDSGRLVGVVLVFRDATHERKSQEVMRKAEKLAAAARLASTVAHEINNPLEAVGNLLYLAKATPGMPAAAAEHLKVAEDELDRVSHITRQTLGFYRETNAPNAIEIPALVDSVLKLYASKFRAKNIQVTRDYSECPPIQGWPGELKQLVSNLISNAADAVSADGALKLKVSCVQRNQCPAVQMVVRDDGPGIAREHLERIFEPFFTTKKDVGTGLGLWVAKEIVERHGGTIQVESSSGNGHGGAAFTVVLPCDAAQSAAAS